MANRKNSSGPKSGDRGREAGKATSQYRAKHNMPKGTQVQHWTKVLPSRAAGMSPDRYNRNLSPLQSRKDGAATTMLTSKDGTKGTTYSVHESATAKGGLSQPSKTYSTEHKFADQHLIPAEEKHIKQSNPKVDKQDLQEAAGASARHKMTGHPGEVSKHVAQHVNLAKGERIPKLPGGGRAANHGSDQVLKNGADHRARGEWNEDPGHDPRVRPVNLAKGERLNLPKLPEGGRTTNPNHGSREVFKDGADHRAMGEWNEAQGHDTRVRNGRAAGFKSRAVPNKSGAATKSGSGRSNSEPREGRGSSKHAGTSGLRSGRVRGFQKPSTSAPSKNAPQRTSGQSASAQTRGGRVQGFQKPATSTPSKNTPQQTSGKPALAQNRGGRVQGFANKATPAKSSPRHAGEKASNAPKHNSRSAAEQASFNSSQKVFKSFLKQNGGKSAGQAKNAGPRTSAGNSPKAPSRGVAAPSRSGGGPRMGGGGGKGR
jgi:hypothetical protein